MANKVVARSEVRRDLPRPGVVVRNHDVCRGPLAILETSLIDLEPDGATVTSEKFRDGWKGKRTP